MWPSQGHRHSRESGNPQGRGGPPFSFLLCGLRKATVIPAKAGIHRDEAARHFHPLMWPSQGHRHSRESRNPQGRGGPPFSSSYVAFARPPSFPRKRESTGTRRPAIFILLCGLRKAMVIPAVEEPAPYSDTGPESRGRGGLDSTASNLPSYPVQGVVQESLTDTEGTGSLPVQRFIVQVALDNESAALLCLSPA